MASPWSRSTDTFQWRRSCSRQSTPSRFRRAAKAWLIRTGCQGSRRGRSAENTNASGLDGHAAECQTYLDCEPVGSELAERLGADPHGPAAAVLRGLHDERGVVRLHYCTADLHVAGLEVDVAPLEPAQLATAAAERGEHRERGAHVGVATTAGFVEDQAHGVDARWVNGLAVNLGSLRVGDHVACHPVPLHGAVEDHVREPVVLLDARGRHALGRHRGVEAVDVAAWSDRRAGSHRFARRSDRQPAGVAVDGGWRSADLLEVVDHLAAGEQQRPLGLGDGSLCQFVQQSRFQSLGVTLGTAKASRHRPPLTGPGSVPA